MKLCHNVHSFNVTIYFFFTRTETEKVILFYVTRPTAKVRLNVPWPYGGRIKLFHVFANLIILPSRHKGAWQFTLANQYV